MSDERTPVLLYAGAKDGRFRFGVPRRDLFAEDVAGLDAATLKDITGGDTPLYVKPVAKTAPAEPAKAGAKE